jgi:hypothetical protein
MADAHWGPVLGNRLAGRHSLAAGASSPVLVAPWRGPLAVGAEACRSRWESRWGQAEGDPDLTYGEAGVWRRWAILVELELP